MNSHQEIHHVTTGGRAPEGSLAGATDEVFTMFSEYVLPSDAGSAVHYSLIVRHCDGVGRPIDGFDAQIAAICRACGLGHSQS
jgi:toxin FitB